MSNPLMEAKLVISADDKTAPVFKDIERRLAAVKEVGAQVGRVSASISSGGMDVERMARSVSKFGMNADNMRRLADSVAQVGRAYAGVGAEVGNVSRQVGALSRAMARVKEAASVMAPAVAAGTAFVGKRAIEAGSELQGERARLGVAGISAETIDAADRQSVELSAKYPNVSRAAILEKYKELRSILLHQDEAPHMLPTVIAAKSAMDALDNSGHLGEGLSFAIKGSEVLGRAQNQERFAYYLDAFIRAQQVVGKTITPEQQYEFAKYVKSSGVTLSDRFILTTAVSLAQELGGSTTGQSVDQFVKQIVGGFQGNNHSAAKEFINLGLAKLEDFELNASGDIKGMKPGHKVAGSDLAQSDPDKWVYQYFLPAMEKKGLTSLEDMTTEVRRSFPAGRAADLVSKIITQRESFANHAKLYGGAAGIQGGLSLLSHDPGASLSGLGTSLENLGATVTSPVMDDAAKKINSLSLGLGRLSVALADWQKDNPAQAERVGATAIGVGAAASGYTALSLYGLVTGKGVPSLGSGVGRIGVVAGSLAYGEAMGDAYLKDRWAMAEKRLSPAERGRLRSGVAAPSSDRGLLAGHWESGRFIHDDDGYGRDFTLGSTGGFSSVGRMHPPSNLGYMSAYDAKRVAPGPLGQIAPGPQQPVRLEGAADIAFSVKIEASPELFRAIETARAVAASGALRASNGVSMPEAAPAR